MRVAVLDWLGFSFGRQYDVYATAVDLLAPELFGRIIGISFSAAIAVGRLASLLLPLICISIAR